MSSTSELTLLIKEYETKRIDELRFILINNHTHTSNQMKAAETVLEKKINEWKKLNSLATNKINELICKNDYFEFHVLSYDGFSLTVAASKDLTYYHNLEIIFKNVFFVSGFFNGWRSDTEKPVFQIPDNEIEMNTKFEIEQDYQVFRFKTENYNNDIIIAANLVSYNTDTVYYYDRPNLNNNERIATFVKKQNE